MWTMLANFGRLVDGLHPKVKIGMAVRGIFSLWKYPTRVTYWISITFHSYHRSENKILLSWKTEHHYYKFAVYTRALYGCSFVFMRYCFDILLHSCDNCLHRVAIIYLLVGDSAPRSKHVADCYYNFYENGAHFLCVFEPSSSCISKSLFIDGYIASIALPYQVFELLLSIFKN